MAYSADINPVRACAARRSSEIRSTFMPSSRFAPPTDAPGFAARRIAADIIDNVLVRRRALDDQLDGASRASRGEDAERSRPRADAPAGRDRAAPSRHAALRAVAPARSRRASRFAAHRDRADARRSANSLDGRARSRRRRSVRAPGAGRPARGAVCRASSTPCCAAARARARRSARKPPRRRPIFRRGCSADGSRITARAPAHEIAAAIRHEPVARHHGQIRRGQLGRAPAWRRAADRQHPHAAARRGDDAARLRRRRNGGCRTRPRRCR